MKHHIGRCQIEIMDRRFKQILGDHLPLMIGNKWKIGQMFGHLEPRAWNWS
jgi:hypothetical protein